jgi:hypothetical protein
MVNVNVNHGKEVFFADNVTIVHNPGKVVIDFTQAVPKFDNVGGKQQQTIAINHNTVRMDPAFAKMFLNVLKENVGKYEKSYGKLQMPKNKPSGKKEIVSESSSRYIG